MAMFSARLSAGLGRGRQAVVAAGDVGRQDHAVPADSSLGSTSSVILVRPTMVNLLDPDRLDHLLPVRGDRLRAGGATPHGQKASGTTSPISNPPWRSPAAGASRATSACPVGSRPASTNGPVGVDVAPVVGTEHERDLGRLLVVGLPPRSRHAGEVRHRRRQTANRASVVTSVNARQRSDQRVGLRRAAPTG